MALQGSGQISASQLRNEFGPTNSVANSVSLGSYRVSQTISGLDNMPLDEGVPQSGPIKYSDFYSKKLNVVVDYTLPSPNVEYRAIARDDYNVNNSKVVVIGNFRQRPTSSSNRKIWIHTNGLLGSDADTSNPPSRKYCSLLTGTWDSDTELIMDIGPSGIVMGSGGDGGQGGSANSTGIEAGRRPSLTGGEDGKRGTSSIGVQQLPILLRNRGIIRSGLGGGGGGGAGAGTDRDTNIFNETKARQTSATTGSGGGGGRGLPAGEGGSPGFGAGQVGGGDFVTVIVAGNAGSNGTISSGGKGGNASGRNQAGSARSLGGAGGGGSNGGLSGNPVIDYPISQGTDGTSTIGGEGGDGQGFESTDGGQSSTVGGSGGTFGYAIIVSGPSTEITFSGSGETTGEIIYNDTPL
jgi:hypothetical protein